MPTGVYKFHGHTLNRRRLEEEIGDCLWYVAELASTFNLDLERIAIENLRKLRSRYPNGFSCEASRRRSKAF